MDNYNFAQQGWQCPICKRVYSPTTSMCYYCGSKETVTTTTVTINPHTFSQTLQRGIGSKGDAEE